MRLSCADTHNGSDNETASGSIRGKERGKKKTVIDALSGEK